MDRSPEGPVGAVPRFLVGHTHDAVHAQVLVLEGCIGALLLPRDAPGAGPP